MNTSERWDDPAVLMREATVADKDQSQFRMYPNIINVSLDIRVMVVLQAFIKWYISRQDENWMRLLKNGINGQLRPVLLLEKRQEPLFLFTLLRLMGKKASRRTLKVEISSLALSPSSYLLHCEKTSSISVLLKVIIAATPLLLVHSIFASIFRKWYWINAFYTCKEFRSKLLIL